MLVWGTVYSVIESKIPNMEGHVGIIKKITGLEGVVDVLVMNEGLFFFTGAHKANVKRVSQFSDVDIHLLR